MENLSEDDFRSYIDNFQTYLHDISDPGPIDPDTSSAVDVDQPPPGDSTTEPGSVDSSAANWSAVNDREEDPATGVIEDEKSQDVDEDDEDRIVADGCNLECEIKDLDLISIQEQPGWCPDVVREEEKEELDAAEGTSVDPYFEGSQNHSADDKDWQVETLKPTNRILSDEVEDDWQVETLKPNSRGKGSENGLIADQDDEGLGEEGEGHAPPKDEEKTIWKNVEDDQTEVTGDRKEKSDFEMKDSMTSDEKLTGQSPGGVEASDVESNPQTTDHELERNEDEDLRDESSSDEDHFALDRSQTATLVKSNRTSMVNDEGSTSHETTSHQMDGTQPQKAEEEFDHMDPELELSTKHSSDDFQAAGFELQTHHEAENHEQEETEEERYCDLLNSNVTETKSDGRQNAAQLKVYPSQVRKMDSIFQSQSETPDEKHPRNGSEVQCPVETGSEEEGRELPEQGSVKTLLAQWRQMEQRKADGVPDLDLEIQPTGSRTSDEVLRMRSKSCDPLASRKHNQLSPSDDNVPTVGARVGRGRSRGTENEEQEQGDDDDDDHYRSQPSLTKAIMAKFENLDLQAANSAIKPKTTKNFKWQVKETTRFCRPGFQPRSGR